MTRMGEFMARHKNPSQSISTILDKEAQRIMANNLKVLESLVKIVMLCGKQGLALRGHRDDQISWGESQEDKCSNQGNLVELVRFRAEHDHILAQHLASSPQNARYTSKTIQNELVEVIGVAIRNDILQEVQSAKYYSIIADEVTDVSNKEHLSLSIRYVSSGTVKEMFIDFVEVERITGKALSEAILHWLAVNGLSVKDLRGQCYDGASNMSGARSGCQAVIQRHAPKAVYVHCSSHRLNLAIVSACKIAAFRNAESYIGEISRFFDFSPKRQRLFDKAVEKMTSASKAKNTVKLHSHYITSYGPPTPV